jgi:hypothetical protein
MRSLAGEQEPNEKKCLVHTPSIIHPSIHGGVFMGAGSLWQEGK